MNRIDVTGEGIFGSLALLTIVVVAVSAGSCERHTATVRAENGYVSEGREYHGAAATAYMNRQECPCEQDLRDPE